MRKFIAATALAAASLSLVACNNEDTKSSASKSTTQESTSSSDSKSSDSKTSESSTSSGGSSTGGGQAATPVSQTITDDVMGHTIKVTQLVRNFPIPDKNESLKKTGEIVLVEVDITAGDKYSGGVQGGFKLKSADGQTAGRSTAFDDEVKAAGFTPFAGVSRGEQGKGFLVFQVNNKSDSYSLTYQRKAASVIGSDETIPEQEWEVPLS